MHRTRLTASLLVAAGVTPGLALSAPADATVVERLRAVEEPYAFTLEDCHEDFGVVFDVAGVFSGLLLIREGTGPRTETYPVLDNYRFEETWTNTDTGETLGIVRHGTFNEVIARPVEGTVFEFQAVEAANTAFYDESGTLVARNRGAVFYTFLFDTLGDGAPGGEYLSEWDVDARGPQEVEDLCATAVALTS